MTHNMASKSSSISMPPSSKNVLGRAPMWVVLLHVCSMIWTKCSSYTLLKPKRHSLCCHGFVVHALLLRMHTNVVDFRVMRRLCHREWNWQWNWRCVNHIHGIYDNGHVITVCDVWLLTAYSMCGLDKQKTSLFLGGGGVEASYQKELASHKKGGGVLTSQPNELTRKNETTGFQNISLNVNIHIWTKLCSKMEFFKMQLKKSIFFLGGGRGGGGGDWSPPPPPHQVWLISR